ncbi:aldo/keto reductase [Pseudooceanicola sediminis]|uniref:Aldo/keto reductase n=1 Tax=Pseudooceanicola sediminis TaxID=2211117 RepID=A0A399J081_9RHOB|nr:aldo/keto reductase [Pseudooceanicola sediminis]KAA2315023.1 aldo/keto reductase [Puniceibacterium sp. HSS470]RII38838.1 aldo/keto reductase [Pseudooceanicola sediminis]|tara:strand:- start:19382 stop:20407 length:1026 start_codon:yes stop_codon:yes gene_type:complete
MTLSAHTLRPLGTTGLSVTALGMGSAPLGGLYGDVPQAQAVEMLTTAWSLGLRYFDTAPMYGRGRAEHLVGHVLRDQTERYILSSKVGRLMQRARAGQDLPPAQERQRPGPTWHNSLPFRDTYDYSYDGILRSYDDSLQRLGVDRIDLLYVHDIGAATHGPYQDRHWQALTRGGGFRALQQLRAAGDISGFGIGANEWQVMRDALEETDLDCCLLAGRYSLLDRDAEADFLPLAARRGVALVLGGVFNSGLLAADADAPQMFNYTQAPQAIVERTNALRGVCADHGVALGAAAIQFPLRHPAVTSVVIGATTPQEITQNVAWFSQDLPPAVWSDLDAALPG